MSHNTKPFDLKTEAVFMTLSGYAKSCNDILSSTETTVFTNFVKCLNKYFSKGRFQYNKSQTIAITNYLSNTIDPELSKLGKSSPQILLILTVDYLVNEKQHLTSRVNFGHFDLAVMIDDIYKNDKYKEHIKSHVDFLWRIV